MTIITTVDQDGAPLTLDPSLSSREALALLDALPSAIAQGLTGVDAEEAARRLADAGAVVQMR